MTRSYSTFYERADGTDVTCYYTLSGGQPASGEFGPPEHYSPAEPVEVSIGDCWPDNPPGKIPMTLTDDEYDDLRDQILGDLPDPDFE
jgi:hypothetical protein